MKNLKKLLAQSLLTAAVVMMTTSCGTLLYPERRGQMPTDRIDAGVAILDALGLLFGVIPGVAAFVIDFSNGTIYLPPDAGSSIRSLDDLDSMRAVKLNPDELTRERIEQVLRSHTGQDIDLSAPNVRFMRLDESSGRPLAWRPALSGL